MSGENTKVVEGGFAALRTGGVDALLAFIDPNFEVTTPSSLASEPDTYRGHKGVRRWFETFYDAMEEIWFEGTRFVEIGNRVVVDFILHASGRSTGIEVEQKAFMTWTIRDGKAVHLELFTDRDQALAAAAR